MCYTSACTFYSPLYASIWLKFWPSWVAWLLYLCPTFPLIRLGHKGSTFVIVTAGSAGCVPQTGWSRKLAFLREYSVGEQKMTFTYCNTCPQMFISRISFCFFFFSLKAFVQLKPCTYDVHILKYVCPLYLEASSTEAYYCYFSSIKLITYARFARMYLFFTIICIDMT